MLYDRSIVTKRPNGATTFTTSAAFDIGKGGVYLIFLVSIVVSIHVLRIQTFRENIEKQSIMKRLTSALGREKRNKVELEVALEDNNKRAYRAAHDFGTALQALVFLVDILRAKYSSTNWTSSTSSTSYDELVKNASAAVSNLVRLRALMMDESRLTLGETLQPQNDTMDPLEILGEIGAVAKGNAGPAGIDFALFVVLASPAAATTELRVDFARMEEIELLPIVTDVNRLVNIAGNCTCV